MAKEKKSSKADKKRNSGAAKRYSMTNRRYTNKIKKVKKHLKKCARDIRAARWLEGANKIFGMEYTRGADSVIKLHRSIYG